MATNQSVPQFSRCLKAGQCEHIFVDSAPNGQAKLYDIREIPYGGGAGENSQNQDSKVEYNSEQSVRLGDSTQVSFRTDSQTGLVTVKAVGLNDLANDPTLPIDISIGMFEYIPGVKDDGTPYPNYGDMQKNGKYIFAANNNGTVILPDPDSPRFLVSPAQDSLKFSQTYYGGKIILEITYLAKAHPTQRLSVRYYFDVLNFNARGTDSYSNNYVVRYFTGLSVPSQSFFTDSSGLEEYKRLQAVPDLPIDRFYYPITSFVYLEGAPLSPEQNRRRRRMSVSVDRAEGCAMPKEGVLEVMLHRASGFDDGRAINESEMEPYQSSILHYIISEDITSLDYRLYRQLQVILDSSPLIFSLASQQTPSLRSDPILHFGSLESVSPHLRVLFTAFNGTNNTMVRLYNMHPAESLEIGEPLRVLRERLGVKVYTLEERSVDYNLLMSQLNQLPDRFNKEKRFPVYIGEGNVLEGAGETGEDREKVVLRPLEMRTFRVIGPDLSLSI